jgi:hypothetical protein
MELRLFQHISQIIRQVRELRIQAQHQRVLQIQEYVQQGLQLQERLLYQMEEDDK